MDFLSKAERSEQMRRVRAKNTSPEMVVRRLVYSLGFRYRLHVRDLPGKPDLVFPGRRKVIFVNGCFWHQHEGCQKARRPVSNAAFWNDKLDANVDRDQRSYRELEELGWSALVIWECETKGNTERLAERIQAFLDRNLQSTPR